MKKVKSDRDAAIEQLLRETRRPGGPSSPTGQCLNAETMAAWIEGGLSARERSAAEAHAADCARCQAWIAAMAKTSPAPVSRSPWRFRGAAWLLPVTAAAAAVIVWAIVPDRTTIKLEDRSMATANTIATAPAPSAGSITPQVTEAKPQEPSRVRTKASSALREEASNERRDAAPEAFRSNKAALPVPLSRMEASRGKDAEAKLDQKEAAAMPPTALQETVTIATPPAAADAAPLSSTLATGSPAPPRAPATVGKSAARAFADVRLQRDTVIVAPNAITRWRIQRSGTGSTVERSVDGGATWQTQQTGVTVPLTAGASPSPSVCWLVGASGTVLLSTDGTSWQRVAFAEIGDLVSVSATDDKHATVTTSDGRSLSTTDGGVKWIALPK